MSYRNKTYIAFSADGGNPHGDIKYYNLMKAWDANNAFDFEFYNAHDLNNLWEYSLEETIKGKLRERLNNSKIFVLLVGEETKTKHKYVRWEIEEAIKQELPIIVVNLNGKRSIDDDLCPTILKNELAVHIGFGQKIMMHALEYWPEFHRNHFYNSSDKNYYYPGDKY